MTGSLFRQIAAELRERIALGDVGPDGALESEAALGERFGASRMTIRKSLELLRDEGLVEARRGAGWFAAGRAFHQRLAIGTFHHAASAVAATGQQLAREVVSFGFVPAPEHIAALLAVPTASQVLLCRSVRMAAGSPLDRSTEWLAGDAAAGLSRSAATDPGIWRSLQRAGVTIDSVRQSITAGIAGPTDVELLGVPSGAPLLLVRRLAVDAAGEVVALSDHRYLAHRFSLEVEFHGWSGIQDQPPGLHDTVS
ncbi:MAG: GntR family transcriptional regulator [Nakamurella sp.]